MTYDIQINVCSIHGNILELNKQYQYSKSDIYYKFVVSGHFCSKINRYVYVHNCMWVMVYVSVCA